MCGKFASGLYFGGGAYLSEAYSDEGRTYRDSNSDHRIQIPMWLPLYHRPVQDV